MLSDTRCRAGSTFRCRQSRDAFPNIDPSRSRPVLRPSAFHRLCFASFRARGSAGFCHRDFFSDPRARLRCGDRSSLLHESDVSVTSRLPRPRLRETDEAGSLRRTLGPPACAERASPALNAECRSDRSQGPGTRFHAAPGELRRASTTLCVPEGGKPLLPRSFRLLDTSRREDPGQRAWSLLAAGAFEESPFAPPERRAL